MRFFSPGETPFVERRRRPRIEVGKAWRVARIARAALSGLAVVGSIGGATAGMHVGEAAAATLPLSAQNARPDAGVVAERIASLAPVPALAARLEPSALTPALRAKGFNACYTPDPGFGPYAAWKGGLSMGQILMPREGGHTPDGGFDVVVHFHGHEAARKSFVEVARGAVLVGIDLGVGSGPYENAFADADRFRGLLASIERALVKQSGLPNAHVRHLALSSWSAGYGAVTKILAHHASKIDAVVLLDSLHADYVAGPPEDVHAIHGVSSLAIKPVVEFARRAAEGRGLFYLSHSRVVPPGYASTSEVADFLLGEIGGHRVAMQGENPLGAELESGFDREGLHLRGYLGRDERAHCAHTELLAEAVRDVLEPVWETPAAKR